MNKKNIRVLQVMDYLAPYEGNFICSLKNLEKKLNKQNGRMIFLFPKSGENIEWIKKLNNECNSKNKRKVLFFQEDVLKNVNIINKIIRKYGINIVHSHFCLPKTQLAVKISCTLNKSVKLIQHYHNHYQISNNFIKKPIFKWIFSGDLNIGCSESVTNSIIYNSNKNITVENAIDFTRLNNYEHIDREELDIGESSKVILMFGFDYLRKGVDLAIEAIKPIAEKYNIILLLSISVGIGNIVKKIENHFGEIPYWVKIVPARNDIASYYHISDIFLSAAREEGFCYAMIEAIYCELKCISSDIPGPPLDTPNIDTFDLDNVYELTHLIEQELGDINNSKRDKIKESKRYVEKKYDINFWSDKIVQIYSSII